MDTLTPEAAGVMVIRTLFFVYDQMDPANKGPTDLQHLGIPASRFKKDLIQLLLFGVTVEAAARVQRGEFSHLPHRGIELLAAIERATPAVVEERNAPVQFQDFKVQGSIYMKAAGKLKPEEDIFRVLSDTFAHLCLGYSDGLLPASATQKDRTKAKALSDIGVVSLILLRQCLTRFFETNRISSGSQWPNRQGSGCLLVLTVGFFGLLGLHYLGLLAHALGG